MKNRKEIKLFAGERIIAAAKKIFVTKGLSGARVRLIATGANEYGLSKRKKYNYLLMK